jgi:hemerythrin superfamily protein
MDTTPESDPTPATPLPPRRGLQLLLHDHHRRLEMKCRDMLAWAYTDDTRGLAAAWSELVAELSDHMTAEEDAILPRYAEHAPEHAKRIRDDHARIRELLTSLGVELDLHEARATRLRQLAEAIEAHAQFEDTTMYPWARSNLTTARISRWFCG